jgi:hypothetical protein
MPLQQRWGRQLKGSNFIYRFLMTHHDHWLPRIEGQSWTGIYGGNSRRLRLSIREQRGVERRAVMEYLDDGSITEVEGRILDELGDPA